MMWSENEDMDVFDRMCSSLQKKFRIIIFLFFFEGVGYNNFLFFY